MKRSTLFKIFSAAVLVALFCGCESGNKASPIDQKSTEDGLTRVENKTADAVYRRPGVTFAGYKKLLLKPIIIEFAKNWKPESGGSTLYQMNPPDREKIKSELADLFAEVFKREMEENEGYPVVTEAAPDVVEMQAAIVNLWITAPDVTTAGRTKVYTTEAGEMTLVMQLHDSVTGQLLTRAYDRRQAAESATWQWTNSVTNSAEARRIIATWATALRKAWDASRSET